jgi:hypothetical protein
MSLAGAAVTDKNDRFGAGDVITACQFMDLLGRDLGIAGKVEVMLSST